MKQRLTYSCGKISFHENSKRLFCQRERIRCELVIDCFSPNLTNKHERNAVDSNEKRTDTEITFNCRNQLIEIELSEEK